MELEIGLFVTGLVVGAGLIWILVDKRVAETTDNMERSYETRLANLQQEVRQADADHRENLQRLIAAELRSTELEAELGQLKRTATANQERARDVKAALAANRPPEPIAPPVPAPEPVAAPIPEPALLPPQVSPEQQARRRLKALEAKRAMLPAGSDARRAIESEIARLRA